MNQPLYLVFALFNWAVCELRADGQKTPETDSLHCEAFSVSSISSLCASPSFMDLVSRLSQLILILGKIGSAGLRWCGGLLQTQGS